MSAGLQVREGLAAAPTLDGVLVRVPAPGVLRLYRVEPDGAPGRYAPEWEASLRRAEAWIPAACLHGPGAHVLVLEDTGGARAWRLPRVRLGRTGPLLEPLLRAALVMRSGWAEEAWAARAGLGAEPREAAVTRTMLASGCALDEGSLVWAVAVRATAREAEGLGFAVALAQCVGRATPGTDAFLRALAEALGEEPPARLGLDVAGTLGLRRGWRARSVAELRPAWRRAAFAAHPDRGGEAGEFQRLRAAWEAVQVEVARTRVLREWPRPGSREVRAVWGGETGAWRILRVSGILCI